VTSKFEARELAPNEVSMWDKLVDESPQGHPFIKSDWLKECSKTWRGDLKIIGCFRGGELFSGCALRILNLGLFKRAAMSRVMVPLDGVVLKPTPNIKNLRKKESLYKDSVNALCGLLEKISFVRLANSPSLVDVRPFTQRGWKAKIHYTYILPLANATLSSYTMNMRYLIRKAGKYNISVERSDDAKDYFELYNSMLLRKTASPTSPRMISFFQRVVELLSQKKNGELWFAKTPSDEKAAGLIVVFHNKRAYGWSAASDGKLLHTAAPSFLMHEVIQRLRVQFSEFDMGGADFPEIHGHSAGYNPELIPGYEVEKSNIAVRICYAMAKKFATL